MAQNQQAYPVPAMSGGISGVTVTGTPSAGQTIVASSGTAASWSTPASGVPRFLPVRDIVSILADSASTHFERHPLLPSVIRLLGRTIGTIADAKANPPRGGTLTNGSALTSATGSGDTLTMNHAASGGGEFYNGTSDAPYYSWSYTRGRGRHGIVFHISASDMETTTHGIRVGLHAPASPAIIIGSLDFYNNAGTRQFRYIVNDTTSAQIGSTRSQAEVLTGTWCWIEFDEYAGNIVMRYQHGSSASEPTSGWLLGIRVTSIAATSTAWAIFAAVTNGSGGTQANVSLTGLRTYTERNAMEAPSVIPAPTPLTFGGFPSVSDTITLASLDYGTGKGLPDQATIRLALADAINQLPGDAGSWTFSFTGDDSANPAEATTYQAAAALVLKVPSTDTTLSTAKRYWILRAKVASTSSLQPASIDLARIPGIYSAAA